jgi:hypothetical protein
MLPNTGAHTCNPCSLGGRDQEVLGLKPVVGKLFLRPYLGKTYHKKGLVEWLEV